MGHMLDITILAGQEKDALEKFKEEHWLAADEEHYGANIPNFRKHEYTLIARDGEKVVGYIYLLVDTDVALIESFLVHTGERRKGIGAALLKRAEEKAAEEGCHVIKLETGVDWHAKEFYEKQGYTLRAHLPNYYGGRDFILMDKRLLK